MNDNLPISTPEQYINIEPYNQYVYYKVVNSNGCENIDKIELQVAEASVVLLESSYVVCTDNPELILEAPAGFDSFFWYKIDNNREELISSFSRIEISEIGNYRLMVGNVYSNNEESIICERSTDFEVIPSNKAVIEDVIISDNNEMAIIEIYAHGDGDYEYSINGIDYQDSNYFENVPSGLITVYVKDRNGCSITEQNIKVESDLWANNFPKFFTPNGDGVNDLWQYIPDPTGDINVLSIEIFNRTGQLLIQLNANSKGWDGSFNGSMLPATDYWFKASFMNQQIKHGHFSLIR
jgi:gliding motility-associated-like protein